LRSLNGAFSFEGGDALFFGDMLFVGTGYRASVSSCEELSAKLDIDVFPLRLVDPDFYHLDMCFFPLDNETAFYYPGAFSPNSVNLLKRLVKNLYPLTKKEVYGYAANSFATEDTVIIQTGNPSFKAVLKRLGKQVVEVDMSEFKKAGGGIHCLINVLERN
jgi:N-dimethylarginine dimethylaminohydrolase